jgi:hypothetical protein
MGRRSLLSSQCVSHHQGQLAATRQMVPTWMVPPPPTASLRWLDRGWLGAPVIRRPGRRQVVGSNWQRLTISVSHTTGWGPRVRLADKFPRHCDCFCEFRFGRDRPLFLFSSFPIVAHANDQEKGAGHNPKGVVADDRNFDKDANDRKNCDQERGDKSKVHLHPLGAWPVCSAHPPVYIYHGNCRPRDCALTSNALGPGPKIRSLGIAGAIRRGC